MDSAERGKHSCSKDYARRRETPLSVDSAEREGNATVAGDNGIEEGVGRVLLAAERAVDAVARCGGDGGGGDVTEMIKTGCGRDNKKRCDSWRYGKFD